MIRWEKNKKVIFNSKIVLAQTKKEFRPKKVEIQKFLDDIEKIQDDNKKAEVHMVRACFEVEESRIVLEENGEINLYFSLEQFLQKTKCTISKNEELYSLLKDLVQS